MMITRDNYEPFFLDYLEGNLDENMIDQFLDFLELNPDLKEELHLFENIKLPEEQVVFAGKEHLYKSANDEKAAFERKAVAFIEGDLKDEERKSFEKYVASRPELQTEIGLFAKTRLVADTGIKFQNKQNLYRKSGTAIFMNWAARAAAVIVLVWGISSLFQSEDQPVGSVVQEIATLKPKTTEPANIQIEPEKDIQKTEPAEKSVVLAENKPAVIHERGSRKQEKIPEPETNYQERDFTEINEITPIYAMLETKTEENQLAVSRSINLDKINDPKNIMSVEEFLANRVKKVGDESLLSVQRIFRTGLNVASEISGDRIGYSVKEGKVSSLEFESRLMAFSIPLQKK
ncbi:MAG TPA: hypothetical protein DHV48_09695 [Prolixibacteraceae bacterium]|nr:hypothetical protein [Prolixibacteraceae bacterium]